MSVLITRGTTFQALPASCSATRRPYHFHVWRACIGGAKLDKKAGLAVVSRLAHTLHFRARGKKRSGAVTFICRSVTMEHRVRKVIALAEDSLHKGWSPAELAALVNLSPSRLHQIFKEETGVPPARYLRQLRMSRARELLETTHFSVKQVMAFVGLTDESHFVRDFKKSCGLTPARYRERFQDGAPAETTPPPLLLRRASHPRQFSEPPPLKRRRELLSLLKRRHTVFVELTNAATDRIVREMPNGRHISYSPRRSAFAHRLPPAVERPQLKVQDVAVGVDVADDQLYRLQDRADDTADPVLDGAGQRADGDDLVVNDLKLPDGEIARELPALAGRPRDGDGHTSLEGGGQRGRRQFCRTRGRSGRRGRDTERREREQYGG